MTNSPEIFLGWQHGYAGSSHTYHFPASAFERHCLVLGKTGMGKTTLLDSLLFPLIDSGRGVCLIDPHGDFAEEILAKIPSCRHNDVIYLDPAEPGFAPCLNLVSSSIPLELRERVASALLAAFRHIWSDSWGPRLEYLLYHALRILLDSDNTSLAALPRVFTDERFRERILRQCRDPFVRRFWEVEFASWDKRFQAEAISPVLNKLGQFVSHPLLRQMFGQVRLKVDFRKVMDDAKILIVNLSKGRLGDDASRLTGALIVSVLASHAMERATIPMEKRKLFTLFVDEAQNFLTGALASLLSESRKYGLGMVLSHQYLDQLPPDLQNAVLGNVGTIFSYRISAKDGERMEREFAGEFSAKQFVDLPPYTALVRPLDDAPYPFRLSVAPPAARKKHSIRPLVAMSQQRYCLPRKQVEEKLSRWLAEDTPGWDRRQGRDRM